MTLQQYADALAHNLLDIFAEINTRSGKPPVVKVIYKNGLVAVAR